ncbi:hypothetical protein E3N88_18284 [Mikania micrantha]|uniref:Uncharacterized protein n=1 Tax=Mikania micrantha TaxID=192012 RepID=A0A5N6NWZ5_9ASTR|nr:hypothetical protein E3N88_18284 [Mikania micrantha]
MVKAPRLKEKKNPWNMVSFQVKRSLLKKRLKIFNLTKPMKRRSRRRSKVPKNKAIRALGNITSISIAYRDLILRASGLDSLIAQFQRNNPAKYSMMRLVARGLSRFCAGKPPVFDVVYVSRHSYLSTSHVLPVVTNLLRGASSEQIR